MRRASLPSGPDIAFSLNSLAGLYQMQGRFKEAEPLLVEALSMYRTSMPPDHPSIAINLNNLALLYKVQNRYLEAGPLYNEALTILTSSLGEHHSTTQAIRRHFQMFLVEKEQWERNLTFVNTKK